MGSARTHPHIDNPSVEQLRDVLEDWDEPVRELCVEAHRLVVEALPDVVCALDRQDGEMGYGARQYGYDGWGMAAVTPYSKWVTVAFLRGTKLDDPHGVLEGAGKTIRHVKLRSREQLEERRGALRDLLIAASKLNQRS